MSLRISLPIDSELPRLIRGLQDAHTLILQAEPGTGKTTRFPPAVLDAPWLGTGEVWVLEPRRLAARMASSRVAEERGELLGATVGYQVRLERAGGPRTRLWFLTEGVFVRKLLSNPELDGVSCVIVDEVHERHLDTDLALALLERIQRRRAGTPTPLRVVMMSATLEESVLARWGSGDAWVEKVSGTRHPVETEYLSSPVARRLEDEVAAAVRRSSGDTLVFLPGKGEIERAANSLGSGNGLQILKLHGELAKEEQAKVFEPSRSRKIVLATNVAESSVTIPGITTVIDSGIARIARVSPWTGMPRLELKGISKASAIQRAGRAGRTGPGRCIRLFTRGEFEQRLPFEVPEILRTDLRRVILDLKRLGIERREELRWVEPPSGSAWNDAEEWLRMTGLLTESGAITDLGARVSELPLGMSWALAVALSPELAALGALAMEEELPTGELDLSALSRFRPRTPRGERVLSDLEARLREHGSSDRREGSISPAAAILRAFWNHVVIREKGAERATLSGGGELKGTELQGIPENVPCVLLEVLELDRKTKVKSMIALQEQDLWACEEPLLREQDVAVWNERLERAELRRRVQFGRLVLEDREVRDGTGREILEQLLAERAQKMVEKIWPLDALREAWSRFGFFESGHPPGPLDAEGGRGKLIAELVQGATSFEELRSIDLQSWLERKHPEARRVAPNSFELGPRRRRVKIHYEETQGPWVASRIQDFFGAREVPTVGPTRTPITVHLLAPNQRPVQVTRDLMGFWEREYPRVRQELKRRYPRHAWPEDPLAPFED